MKKLREDSAPDTVITTAQVHILRLESNPDTTSLAPATKTSLDEFTSAAELHHERRIARMGLTGKLNYADSVADDLVMGASRKVLDLVDGDRESLIYRAAFPVSASEGTAGMATSEQDKFIAGLVHALRTNPDLSSLSALADPIEAAQAEITVIRKARDEAYAAEGIAFNALQIARIRLIDIIHSNHPRLQLIFPKKKRLVESFFP
jgi:hypothetical protein